MAGPASGVRRTERLVLAGGGVLLIIIVFGAWALLQQTTPEPVAQETRSSSPSPSPTVSSAASPVTTPTPTPSPSGSRRPISTPSPTPVPERSPLVLPAWIADVGSRAMVTADRLRVRSDPGLHMEIWTELLAGTELLLRDGPVPADGFDWYWVAYSALPDEPNTGGQVAQGWVAVGPSGAAPTFVRIDPPRCPSLTITASLLGAMGGLARSQCVEPGAHAFTAVIDTCFEGPITYFDYEPGWLWFSCLSAFDLGSEAHLSLFFPPDLEPPDGLARGSVVRVVGHLNDPAAADCHVVVPEGTPVYPALIEAEQAWFALQCTTNFVLDEIEVTDKIDLPPRF